MKRTMSLLLCGQLALAAYGQQQPANPNPTQVNIQKDPNSPLYRITVNVVERTTTAINYQHRAGATKIDFRGTPLMPPARGEAKVESKRGYIEIEVEFDELEPASRFGPEYLTYVMWAVTPDGRASNLGEVILGGTESKLNVTTELQSFALIVTAEPYFAVTQPSDVVVMENVIRSDTRGKFEEVAAKYELLQRGQYTTNVPPADLKPIPQEKGTPLDLLEARNAVRIAEWAGAPTYAAETWKNAQDLLARAETAKARKSGTRPIAMNAREAVQTAEDARLIALKRRDEQRLAAERQAADLREANARQSAESERQRAESERQRADAERQRAEREASLRSQALADEAAAKARAERATQDALAAEGRARDARASADAEAERARQLALDAERDKARLQAQSEEEKARLQAQAEQEKAALREQLTRQLNLILETRDSARGLIVNLSDVLFDFGKYTLRPETREKLAKISGIILAHPGLALDVEGHTDDVGTDAFNQKLSEQRADEVQSYLRHQGLTSVTARGFGESRPIVPNDSNANRQKNRRVEMIVSGDLIGRTTVSQVR